MSFFPPLSEPGRIEILHVPGQQALLQAANARTPSGRWAYRTLAVFAGRRWGKTAIGAILALERLRQPGTIGWATAPSYDDLHDFVVPAVCRLLPASWVPRNGIDSVHRTIRTKAGSIIAFRSLDDPDKPRGPGLDWWWIDEARKVSPVAYQTGRPMLADRQGQLFAMTTPNGFDWCYEQLWVPAQRGEPGYWAIRTKTIENPLPGLREEVEAARRTTDPRFFAQEYEADFVSFTGAVYGDLILRQSVADDAALAARLPGWPKLDPSWPIYGGIDPGTDHPFAAVVAVRTPIGLVVLAEYEARDRAIAEHQTAIARVLHEAGVDPMRVESWAVDQTQRQWTLELSLGPWGLPTVPAENDVPGGINRVKTWLYAEQLWFVRARTPTLLERLQGYQYANNYTRDEAAKAAERVLKRHDDLPDALRYLVMSVGFPEFDRPLARPRVVPAGSEWAVERLARIEAQAAESTEPEYLGPPTAAEEEALRDTLQWLRGGDGLTWEDDPIGQLW